MLNKFHIQKLATLFCFIILFKLNFFIASGVMKNIDLTKIEYNKIIALLLTIVIAIICLFISTRKKGLRDFKTGVRNTEYLKLYVEQNIRHKKIFSLFYIDLDKFKSVNDQYGHEVGDEFLIAFSKLMTKALPKSATFYRIGGDEFVVVAQDVKTFEEKNQIIKCINKVQNTKITIEGNKLNIAFSIGVATFPTDSKSFCMLKSIADECMYKAKKNEKCNFVIYGENQK